jgi:hypothetical protein
MECQRGDKTHNALWHPLRGLRHAVIRVQVGIGKLIDATRQADDLARPLHTTQRRRGHAGRAQLEQAHHAALLQQDLSQRALGLWLRHLIQILDIWDLHKENLYHSAVVNASPQFLGSPANQAESGYTLQGNPP